VDYKGDDKNELTKKMVKLALSSPARYCIIPIQDYLLLGNEARINTPSTLGQNWRFRIDPEALTKKIEKRIRSYCVLYYRV
jgi:4-alpha-glucanotransferase